VSGYFPFRVFWGHLSEVGCLEKLFILCCFWRLRFCQFDASVRSTICSSTNSRKVNDCCDWSTALIDRFGASAFGSWGRGLAGQLNLLLKKWFQDKINNPWFLEIFLATVFWGGAPKLDCYHLCCWHNSQSGLYQMELSVYLFFWAVWQVQPKVAHIRVHNNLPTGH